jgi:putative hydrolase of the HAD superfamily
LLSNTNKIHYDSYVKDLQQQFGYPDFEGLFEKAFFSFELGLVKPHTDIYEKVLDLTGINAAETVFIDDSRVNCDGAEKAGLKTWHLKPGEEIIEIFNR